MTTFSLIGFLNSLSFFNVWNSVYSLLSFPASTAKKSCGFTGVGVGRCWVLYREVRPSERGPVPGSTGLPVKGDVSMSRCPFTGGRSARGDAHGRVTGGTSPLRR